MEKKERGYKILKILLKLKIILGVSQAVNVNKPFT